jgi:two-component system cell cycle sensor histidine kinase/response regulator CckA
MPTAVMESSILRWWTHRQQEKEPVGQQTDHILVVDDQPSIREVYCRALRTAGYSVSEAANVAEARALLDSSAYGFDLVVTDMIMPGESGAALARDARVAGRNIPVVIVSGYSDALANADWKAPPNAVFLEKPLSPQALVATVRRIIESGEINPT